MKKMILLILIMIFVFSHSTSYAEDIGAPELYNKLCDIMKIDEVKYMQPVKNVDVAIDYAVEILKKWPESIEAVFALNRVASYFIIFDEKAKQKCIKWRDDFLENPNNLGKSTAEILVYTSLLNCRSEFTDKGIKYIDIVKKDRQVISNTIDMIKNECKDERYRALALTLSFGALGNESEYEFINKYPSHFAIPFILLQFSKLDLLRSKYQKCITETLSILDKYKNVKMPGEYGKFESHCYIVLAEAYCIQNDYQNSMKYIKLIKEKDPGYSNMKKVDWILSDAKHKEENAILWKNRPNKSETIKNK